MLKHALKGLVNNIQTIPIEKIWIPDPDMYSMIACIGSDLAGLFQAIKGQSSALLDSGGRYKVIPRLTQ